MIYLEQTLNISPSRYDIRDEYIKVAEELLIPSCKRHGARLVAAWNGHHEWFNQTIQIFEFDDIEDLKNFRINASQDKEWAEYLAQLEVFAPERRTRLLEPTGAVPPEVLHKTIEESQNKPFKAYSMATLEVNPGKMRDFIDILAAEYEFSPIVVSWRPIAGSPNQVMDLWKGDLLFNTKKMEYRPFNKDQQVSPLHDISRNLRITPLYTLPYSPLK